MERSEISTIFGRQNTNDTMRILLFLLLPFLSVGQTYKIIDGKEYVITPIDSAARIAYWGEKGIECEPLVDSMEAKTLLQEREIGLQFTVNSKLKLAQEEYRTNLQRCADANLDLSRNNVALREERDNWKAKAKRRGTLIAGASGAILGLIVLTLTVK